MGGAEPHQSQLKASTSTCEISRMEPWERLTPAREAFISFFFSSHSGSVLKLSNLN